MNCLHICEKMINMDEDYQIDRINFYLSSGQFQDAIDLLKKLLSEDPNEPLYHASLAECLLASKRLYAAEYEIGIALQLDPQIPYLHLIKAKIETFKNNPKKALEFCDEALSQDPEYVDVLILKSTIFSIMGDSAEELSCINQALALEPDSVDTVTALGDYQFSQGKLSEALETAKIALSINPQDEDANLLMGRVSLDLGDVENAEYHAKFVIMQNPDSSEALTLFSNIKAQKSSLLGVWWRLNSKIGKLSDLKASLILVLAYIVFMLLAQILDDLGYGTASLITSYAWLLLVVYSWVATPLYYRQLKKELEKFQFDKDY